MQGWNFSNARSVAAGPKVGFRAVSERTELTGEKAFSKLKAHLRKIAERTVADLMRALEACADFFKSAECTNYFAACGYDTT